MYCNAVRSCSRDILTSKQVSIILIDNTSFLHLHVEGISYDNVVLEC